MRIGAGWAQLPFAHAFPLRLSLVDLVVHELRTPLTVAIGSLRQVGGLARPHPAGGRGPGAAIVRAAGAAGGPDARLDASRGRAGRARRVPLAPALAEAVRAASADPRGAALSSRATMHQDVIVRGPAPLARLTPWPRCCWRRRPRRRTRRDHHVEVTVADDSASARGAAARRRDARTAGETFDAEWLGGLGFSLPLARAVIAAGGGDVTSAHAADGRLQSISVRLAVAASGAASLSTTAPVDASR